MDEITFLKSQIIHLEHLLTMCEDHPLMSNSLRIRINDYKKRLDQCTT